MLMELSVIPLGRGCSISADLADVLKRIDSSGLDYRLTPTGTVVEGEADALFALAKSCHAAMREKTDRVITLIKLDDYAGRTGRIAAAVESVAEKAGKPLRK
jgi:uncharacterized protein (TIGR00106 family)